MSELSLVSRLIRQIPAPLYRALLRVGQPWRLWWWGVRAREVEGVMVLGFADDGRLVLVRHSYHLPQCWLAPGGGRARGEDVLATARREMAEETGCTLHAARHLGQVRHVMPQGWINRIELVGGRISGTPRADGREIVEAALFAPDALPPGVSPAVRDYLARWQQSEG